MKFSQEQLDFIAKHFVVKEGANIRALRDGIVEYGDMVWWRNNEGPKYVGSHTGTHWNNMRGCWQYYQLEEPTGKFVGYVYNDN